MKSCRNKGVVIVRSSNKAEDRLLFSGGADDDVRLIVWDYLDRVKVNEAMNFFNDYRGSIYNLNIIRFDDPKFKQKLPASTQLAEEELYAKSNFRPNFLVILILVVGMDCISLFSVNIQNLFIDYIDRVEFLSGKVGTYYPYTTLLKMNNLNFALLLGSKNGLNVFKIKFELERSVYGDESQSVAHKKTIGREDSEYKERESMKPVELRNMMTLGPNQTLGLGRQLSSIPNTSNCPNQIPNIPALTQGQLRGRANSIRDSGRQEAALNSNRMNKNHTHSIKDIMSKEPEKEVHINTTPIRSPKNKKINSTDHCETPTKVNNNRRKSKASVALTQFSPPPSPSKVNGTSIPANKNESATDPSKLDINADPQIKVSTSKTKIPSQTVNTAIRQSSNLLERRKQFEGVNVLNDVNSELHDEMKKSEQKENRIVRLTTEHKENLECEMSVASNEEAGLGHVVPETQLLHRGGEKRSTQGSSLQGSRVVGVFPQEPEPEAPINQSIAMVKSKFSIKSKQAKE